LIPKRNAGKERPDGATLVRGTITTCEIDK
jgi:hypothetical protein